MASGILQPRTVLTEQPTTRPGAESGQAAPTPKRSTREGLSRAMALSTSLLDALDWSRGEMSSFSSYRCFGLPWFWSPHTLVTTLKGDLRVPRGMENLSPYPHCVFANVGYELKVTKGLPVRHWVYVRDASVAHRPLLFAGNATLDAFPPCFASSMPRHAEPHERYCFSPRVVHAAQPRRWKTNYRRGVLLSWAGVTDNFGHLFFEQLLRVHTLLQLDDAEASDRDGTLIILLWGGSMAAEHGAPSDDQVSGREHFFDQYRWQRVPLRFSHADGPGSSLWRWLRLFSSHDPVRLSDLPSDVGFGRLHVGDAYLDHFTSLGAKPTQYHAFTRHVGATTRHMCPSSSSSGPAAVAASRGPLVLALDKPHGRRRPLNLRQSVEHLRQVLRGSGAQVKLLAFNESTSICTQLRWLQAADVIITPAGGISVAAAFLRPGTSVISFGVRADHEQAEGSWDYDLVRLQAFGNAVRKIYSVLSSDLDHRSSDCMWNHEGWQDSDELKTDKRTREQLTLHGRQSLCSFFINSSRLAQMVTEELDLQRNFLLAGAAV